MPRLELESGAVVSESCAVANTVLTRMRGLLGKSSLEDGESLLIEPCNSVHTMFMRFPLDVVFCDRSLLVLSVAADVAPWRVRGRRGAKIAIEFAAGEAARRGVTPGSQLRLVD